MFLQKCIFLCVCTMNNSNWKWIIWEVNFCENSVNATLKTDLLWVVLSNSLLCNMGDSFIISLLLSNVGHSSLG